MIELTPEQLRAVEQGEPVRVIDPATRDAYIVVRAEVYERLASAGQTPAEETDPEVSRQLLRSAQAFWRDLPELLKRRRNRGKWVAYYGDERIGIASNPRDLVHVCVRRGIEEGEYHLDVIEAKQYPPWHVEDVEYGLAEIDDGDAPDLEVP
jgi:hypothetical protein